MRALISLVIAVMAAASFTVAGEVKLPAPKKKGGTPLFEAIDQRGSAGQSGFPTKKIPDEDLATILWAATGTNRDGRLWTVPMAMGRPPYCKIYITSDDGVFRYDWKNHSLVEISRENVKADIPLQPMVKNAPLVLYLVVDGEEVAKLNAPMNEEAGPVLAGAMSQDIYLAAAGVGVGTRVIYSIKRDEASRLLKLPAKDKPLFAMPMGKK